MYPRQRGSASSLQAFTGLVMNALLAGVLSPLLSHRGIHLALASALFALLGWVFWRWEMGPPGRHVPDAQPDAGALEPTERLQPPGHRRAASVGATPPPACLAS